MRRILSIAFVLSVIVSLTLGQSAPARPRAAQGRPTATGRGGAAASVDPLATRTAIRVLRRGGNAVDAAVAAAAVLGVVEPYSCGIGGGGFMLIGRGDKVATNDHRETAPAAYEPDTLIDPDTGEPIPFEEAVTSGLSVGVPGTVRGWDEVLERFGTMPLSSLLQPAISIAREGFVVDDIFASQTRENLERFRSFTSTRSLFLTDEGRVPRVGSVFRNRDLAHTYDLIAERGADAFYQGKLARALVQTVKVPPETRSSDLDVRPGLMTAKDLAGVTVRRSERRRMLPIVTTRCLGWVRHQAGAPPFQKPSTSWRASSWERTRAPGLSIATSKPRALRSPIATFIWATPTSSTCRWRACYHQSMQQSEEI